MRLANWPKPSASGKAGGFSPAKTVGKNASTARKTKQAGFILWLTKPACMELQIAAANQ
jgi:hypothetical protein